MCTCELVRQINPKDKVIKNAEWRETIKGDEGGVYLIIKDCQSHVSAWNKAQSSLLRDYISALQ